jgi:ABC-type uncharacterized transport system substrate-binding protein
MEKDFEPAVGATSNIINVLYAMCTITEWRWGKAIRRTHGWRLSLLLFLGIGIIPQSAIAAKCLFISSYHRGYTWSDGVERGIRDTIGNRCELRQWDMDTKRNQDQGYIEQKALEAKALIESWKPDVVITADDVAAKYIIKPFYKDHTIPFVFCGINWTVQEYDFPYRNVTGMIEIAPIDPLFDKAETYVKAPHHAFYIGANTLTEHKNLKRFQQAAKRRGLKLDYGLVSTTEDWLAVYETAQTADFVILGSNSGINDWDRERILHRLERIASRMTLTNHEWMMPYTMLGLTKVPEEHGEWAAQTALLILSGVPPSSVPIVPNRKWDIWVNPKLLAAVNIQLPKAIMQKAKKVY